jgi:hypothetical protein
MLQPAGKTIFDADDMRGSDDNPYYPFDESVIPYEVLVFAPNIVIPDQLRGEILDVIENFLTDRVDGVDRLDNLLEATGIMRVNESSYLSFSAMLIGSGWDMTAAD